MSTNQHTLEDTGIMPNVKEYSGAFAGIPISSLIGFHLESDQDMLHEDSRDYMAFQTMEGMYQLNRLALGGTNSASEFVRVSRKRRNHHLGSIMEVFADDIGVHSPTSLHREEQVDWMPAIQRLVWKTLRTLITYVPMWTELVGMCLGKSMTSAGMG
jgi:hypothetical protein